MKPATVTPKVIRPGQWVAGSPRQRVYLGIDPGINGGLVALGELSTTGVPVISVEPMPATERDVWDWFAQWRDAIAIIERVHSFPGQGVASTFTFGKGYGGLRMALVGCGIPFEEVSPGVWLRGLSIPKRKPIETNTQWKNRLKALAQQIFPSVKVTLATADALLIAEYCRRKHKGTL